MYLYLYIYLNVKFLAEEHFYSCTWLQSSPCLQFFAVSVGLPPDLCFQPVKEGTLLPKTPNLKQKWELIN